MPEPAPEIRRHYESEIVEADRLARGAGRLELVRTQEIIRRHVPGPPLEVLDVGRGAGVHAVLADDGHSVQVIDPMPSHVDQARLLAGLDCVEVVGVEGVAGWLQDLFGQWDDATHRDAILFVARATEAEPSLIGAARTS